MSNLSGKPWNEASAPEELKYPKGMLGDEERRAFYWLARNYASGSGFIVDAGTFLGASTFCFAAGAAAAGHYTFDGRPIVQAYDYFAAMDQYVANAIARDFRPIKEGESYIDIFQYQTGKYASLIETHPGDFLEKSWGGSPIEILFIDLAKTQSLCCHVIRQMFSALIPGKSLVIHQDYYHCWHPYIHITMEYLDEYFELVDSLIPHQSRVWRLVKAIPEAELARLAAYDLSAADRIQLLDRLVLKSSDRVKQMIEVVRLWQRVSDGSLVEALEDYKRLNECYQLEASNDLWADQAREIAKRLPIDVQVSSAPEVSSVQEPSNEAPAAPALLKQQKPDVFCIISFPRTGSNLMVERLNSSPEVACHQEVFHKERMYSHIVTLEETGVEFNQRSEDPGFFIEKLVEATLNKRPRAKSVGVKMFAYLDPFNHKPLEYVLNSSSLKKIFLDRSNRLDQYSSLLIAREKGEWSRTHPGGEPVLVNYDEEEFVDFVYQHDDLMRHAKTAAQNSGSDYVCVDYEDITGGDMKKHYGDIFSFLNIRSPKVFEDALRKQNPISHMKRFANFDELVVSIDKIGRREWLRR